MRIAFLDLVSVWPLFSALGYAFVRSPRVSFKLSAQSLVRVDVMNIPLLSNWLHDLMNRLLRDWIVLPNSFIAPDWRKDRE